MFACNACIILSPCHVMSCHILRVVSVIPCLYLIISFVISVRMVRMLAGCSTYVFSVLFCCSGYNRGRKHVQTLRFSFDEIRSLPPEGWKNGYGGGWNGQNSQPQRVKLDRLHSTYCSSLRCPCDIRST